MDIKQALIDTSMNKLPMMGLMPVFQGDTEEAQLVSANQVNVLIGLSGAIRGNIVFGLKKTTALKVVSAMMNGAEIDSIDDSAKKVIVEAAGMIVEGALGMLEEESGINVSLPTMVMGERIFLLVSKVKSNKLSFSFKDDVFTISFSLD